MEAEVFELIECACAHYYVRSSKRGTDWTCPHCGEAEDYDNIVTVAGPARNLTKEEAGVLLGSSVVTPASAAGWNGYDANGSPC